MTEFAATGLCLGDNRPMKRLLLVDGSSFLYRAFHALPDLRNPAGEPTGAIYGMIGMLRRLRMDYPADFAACVFDAKGPTFRDAMFDQYKAHRSPMPEDLVAQIEPIHEAVRAMGWPLLMVEGVEADDVIATLAHQASTRDLDTVICTGDKDLAQLVDDHVSLVNTMSRDGKVEVLDVPGVQAKFGVPPERIVDYLALVGDTVDNVPGVDKVGPKTAVKWLAEHGSLDAIVAKADAFAGAIGENLRRALPQFELTRALLTVKRDCDLDGHVVSFDATLAMRTEDREELRRFFERKGFRTWLKELDSRAVQATPNEIGKSATDAPAVGETVERQYECVLSEQQLDAWLARIQAAELTCLDTETTSLDPMLAQIVGLSLSVAPGKACYIPLAHRYADAPAQLDRDTVLARLKPWLESPAHAKVGQHLKYDQHVFENHGIRLAGITHDTLLQSYVLEAHKTHDMDSLARRHLDESTITFEEVAGKGANQIGFDQVAIERATEYAAEDADITLRLHHALWPQVQRDAGLQYVYQSIELPVAQVLQRMERTGVLINAELLGRQSNELGQKMLELERQAYEVAGQPFNLASPKQIGELLFVKQQLPVVKKTASGAPSTDEEVLQKLAEDYPLPRLILEHRGMAKLKGTYTDKLPRMVNPKTGRVHTSYGQAIAVTGRLASNDPNLQNIPIRTAEGRRIREAFVAAPRHVIVSADYSQIELRIMAHISNDENLLHAFAQGQDVHRATAAEIFGITPLEVTSEQRRYAKVINFGLIYGMSAFGLAGNLGISRDAAKQYIDRYFQRYPAVARYMDETRQSAKAKGYVETVFGRRLWLAEINSPNGPRRQGAERAAINAPMQGTAADLIKLAMIAVQRWLDEQRLGTRLIMQVHDELVLEVPEHELGSTKTRIAELMAGVAQLRVPLLAEVGSGPNWDSAH
jgi:DNA polymerase-1